MLRYMLEDKDMYIKYTVSEEKPEDIMDDNCSETYHAKHVKIIMEGELWGIMETGRKNVKNNGVLYGVMDFDLIEYSSHSLSNAMNQENSNELVLVTISSNGKKI